MTTFFPAGAPNQSASGTLTNVNDAVILATDTLGSVDFALAGTPVGATVAFESTSDGTNWVASKAYQKGGTGAAGSTTATAAGVYNVSVGGAKQVRARLSAVTSGSFAVVANGTVAQAHIGVKNANPQDLQTSSTLTAAFSPTANSLSGTIGVANQDAVLLPANASRRFLLICNTHATAVLLISLAGLTTAANAPLVPLNPGATLILDVAVPNVAIHAQSATAGATYSIVEG